MPLTYPAPSEETDRLLTTELEDLLSDTEIVNEILGNIPPEDITIAHPLEVYFVKFDDVEDEHLFTEAHGHCWRYMLGLIENDQFRAVATVQLKCENLDHKLQSLSTSGNELIEALEHAENLPQIQESGYEPRILEITDLRVTALWLHGNQEILLPIPNAHHKMMQNTPHSQQTFIDELNEVLLTLPDQYPEH